MAVFKCKMCGGALEVQNGESVAVCEYCGTKQTVSEKEIIIKETVVVKEDNSKVRALIERAFLFLEDEEWESADEYCEKILDLEPQNAMAYLGKLCVELEICGIDGLSYEDDDFEDYLNFKKAVRFADDELKARIDCILNKRDERLADERRIEEEREAKERKEREEREVIERKKKEEKEKREAKIRELFPEKLEESIFRNRQQGISAGGFHTVGLKSDRTVVVVGFNKYGQCNVENWKNIVAISAGGYHTTGLKSDGTVVAVGNNGDGQCGVSSWKNIVAISAGGYHTVGLKSDGTVVAVGNNGRGQCNVENWKNIVAISAGGVHTVGLKSDGTVVAVGYNNFDRCNVKSWRNIVAISAGGNHTVGLKSDGTVVAVGNNGDGQCNVENWENIVAVYAGDYHTVGLKSDGTVVAVGNNEYGQCGVEDWKNVLAVSAGNCHTVGLKSDGTVVAAGGSKDGHGECDVSGWVNIAVPLEKEEYKAKLETERKAKIEYLEKEKATLKEELPNIKGLFSGSKKAKIEARIAEIEKELQTLK